MTNIIKKMQISKNFKQAEERLKAVWDSHAVLGDETADFVNTTAVTSVMHSSAATRANMVLAFLAANGVSVRLREKGASITSFGSFLYSPKKTGKSNFTDFIYENGEAFEVAVNKKVCENIEQLQKKASEAVENKAAEGAVKEAENTQTHGIIYKNMGVEEMLAKCDASKKRLHYAMARAEAEVASFCEQVNMLGTGGASKKYENQGAVNELFDTGRYSKAYRDQSRNYGKDIYQTYLRLKSKEKPSFCCFYHAGCLNHEQAYALHHAAIAFVSQSFSTRYAAQLL